MSFKSLPVIVLCGGKGTRMSTLTNDKIPKHLLSYKNHAIIDHSIEPFIDNNRLIFSIGHHSKKLVSYLEKNYHNKLNFTKISRNGIFESIINAIEEFKIEGDFILIHGDEFVEKVNYNKLYKIHKDNYSLATLIVTKKITMDTRYGFVTDDNNKVIKLQNSNLNTTMGIGTGTFVLNTDVLKVLKKHEDWYKFLENLIDLNKLYCHIEYVDFINFNEPKDLSK